MCGIFGITAYKSLNGSHTSLDLLRHRGPDAEGRWQDDEIMIEHTRLSIIDLSKKANQPFCFEKDYVLSYNGEIYNFMQLRKDLEALGDRFLSHSDTEVLYRLFIRYGVKSLDMLNGMFAFAFYDKKKKKLYLARDRYGIKPLYYYFDGKHLIFSSEQKSIYNIIKPVLNYDYLPEYFSYKFIAGKFTIAKDVYEIEPGYFAEYDLSAKRLNYNRWYKFPGAQQYKGKDPLSKLESLLDSAVSLRTICDVPMGVQLSGGVDSAIITNIVASHSNKIVSTYSIGFPGSVYNEEDRTRAVSTFIGTKHTQIDYGMNDFMDDWEKAVYHNDEPINHPHSLPIMKLTRIARKDVKVLLSGEGADEVFYGYEQYRDLWDRTRYKNNEEFMRACCFNDKESLGMIMSKQWLDKGRIYGVRPMLLKESAEKKYNEKFYEFSTHLVGLLNRIDKMSMANAVEIRTPYLDYRLVEFGLSQDKDDLIDSKDRKKPIMALYNKFFDKYPASKRKIGFRVPYDEWLSDGRFRARICGYISTLRADPLFNKGYIEELVLSTKNGILSKKQIKEGWVLTNYAIWKQVFKPSYN